MNLAKVHRYQFPPVEQDYSAEDAILYALALGYGSESSAEMPFVLETEQKVVPTICNVLGHPGFWLRDVAELGIDWKKILHGEQMLRILRPIPAAGKIVARHRIAAVEDRKEKGAVIYFEKIIELAETQEQLATARWTIFARGDGGHGGFGDVPPVMPPLPEGAAEKSVEIATSKRAALLYRLSGDMNPIHADPNVARQAGFDRPILHGLCTMGVACRAILQTYCDNEPGRLKEMFVRFSQPVYPGETIRIEFFQEADALRFRAIAVERNVVVLDRGSAKIG